MKQFWKALGLILKVAVCCLCLGLACSLLLPTLLSSGTAMGEPQKSDANYALTDRYNMFITNTLSDTLDGMLSIPKTYWLSDDDLVAPKPNPNGYGATEDPTSLQWLLDKAAPLLDGQETLFTTQTQILPGSQVHYYYDETILVITWKQLMDGTVYTVSEVKIADPSQFRRFVADGEYGSYSKYYPQEMATSVNAVMATNADFYIYWGTGIVVYDGKLMRASGRTMDSCFIDRNGDLLMTHIGELTRKEDMEKFIEDNGIRFSLAFGPILIEDGEVVDIKFPYPVGEGNMYDTRMALCQRDKLHYMLVTSTQEPGYGRNHNWWEFAANIQELGCEKAYNLDGGQSATVVMNNEVLNHVKQRQTSDIIYFATAIPNGE